jgi:hypothetical protein
MRKIGLPPMPYVGGFPMTYVRDRKNRLSFVTNSTARYRGREREIVVEVFPEYAAVRLLGTRTKYEVSWRAISDLASEIRARRERERKGEKPRENL